MFGYVREYRSLSTCGEGDEGEAFYSAANSILIVIDPVLFLLLVLKAPP